MFMKCLKDGEIEVTNKITYNDSKFISRKDMRSISSRGPIDYIYVFVGLVRVYCSFKTFLKESPFWNVGNAIFDGRVYGRTMTMSKSD